MSDFLRWFYKRGSGKGEKKAAAPSGGGLVRERIRFYGRVQVWASGTGRSSTPPGTWTATGLRGGTSWMG